MCEEKKDYGATLNLPKTEFPMRGNLPENEPKILEEILQDEFYIRCQRNVCAKKKIPAIYLQEGQIDTVWQTVLSFSFECPATFLDAHVQRKPLLEHNKYKKLKYK